jgi:hypothetical protein
MADTRILSTEEWQGLDNVIVGYAYSGRSIHIWDMEGRNTLCGKRLTQREDRPTCRLEPFCTKCYRVFAGGNNAS